MLASTFVVGGLNAVRNAPTMAPKAKPVADKIVGLVKQLAPGAPIPTDTTSLVRLNGAVQLIGGAMLATGHLPRLSSLLLAGSLVPTTAADNAFWKASDPTSKQQLRVLFLKNVAVVGGLLMASLDPDPHKKVLVLRAKDKAVAAKDRALELAPGS